AATGQAQEISATLALIHNPPPVTAQCSLKQDSRQKTVDHRIHLIRYFELMEMPRADGLSVNELGAQFLEFYIVGQLPLRADVKHRHLTSHGCGGAVPCGKVLEGRSEDVLGRRHHRLHDCSFELC